MTKKRIGILTGGGDCPGLNAVIRGITKAAINQYGYEVIGFYDGFLGMIEGRFDILNDPKVSGILTLGGTILGSSNKADPFQYAVKQPDGSIKTEDVSDQCMDLYNDLGLDALICIGGDGTLTCGAKFSQKGAKVIGVPKTIDKDLVETDVTFGFDSALVTATEAIDKLHTTAAAHHRVMLVEVMGRNAGWLALESGIAGGGDIILIPEIPYDLEEVVKAIRKRSRFGKKFSIVVVSEGSRPIGGEQTVKRIVSDSPEQVRLGGCSHIIANQIEQMAGIECRVAVLGHLQRGGSPTPRDRILATGFAIKALEMCVEGKFNCMAALQGSSLVAVPLEKVMGRQKLVTPENSLIRYGVAVGTSFGVDKEKLLSDPRSVFAESRQPT